VRNATITLDVVLDKKPIDALKERIDKIQKALDRVYELIDGLDNDEIKLCVDDTSEKKKSA
jgi:tyrosine-protein phosphatase YwqE